MRLNNMKWLLENKCPLSACTFYMAIKNDDNKTLNWLFKVVLIGEVLAIFHTTAILIYI